MHRFRAYWTRLRKERPDRWIRRHGRARAQLWFRLMGRPPSEAALAHAERHMARLCALPLPWLRLDHRLLGWIWLPATLFPKPRYSRLMRH